MKLFANPLLTGAMLFLLISVSCVSPRLYQDIKAKNAKCEDELDYLKTQNKELTEKSAETDLNANKTQRKLDALQLDTLTLGTSLRKMIAQ